MEAPPRRTVVAWVGGFLDDRERGVVRGLYEAYKKRTHDVNAENTRYFKHSQRRRLAKWIRMHQDDAYVIVIGHSWGAAAAARVVAKGNAVDKLVTVDPVSLRWKRPRALRKVAKYSGVWHNYDSISQKSTGADIIAGVGRRWDDAPKDFATSHTPVDLNHVDICMVHCTP